MSAAPVSQDESCTDFCVAPEPRDARQLSGPADAHALMQIALDAAVERARVFRALALGCKGYLREAEIRRAPEVLVPEAPGAPGALGAPGAPGASGASGASGAPGAPGASGA
jgi:hypothetical protein